MSTNAQRAFRKKYNSQQSQVKEHQQNYLYQTPYRKIGNKLPSYKQTEQLYKTNFSIQSSMIAQEPQTQSPQDIQNNKKINYQSIQYQDRSQIKQQAYSKDRQLYFLHIQLQNFQVRYKELEHQTRKKDQQIYFLEQQINKLKHNNGILEKAEFQKLLNRSENLQIENEKLKNSLEKLIKQKHQSTNKNYKSINNYNSHIHLKKQVQQLHVMVSQLKNAIDNCPSCFSLARQKEELAQAYDSIQKLYSDLRQEKDDKEKCLLKNITMKIQQNQNIIRQNLHLREETLEKKNYLRRRKQNRQGGVRQSIAKRCRTLTEY